MKTVLLLSILCVLWGCVQQPHVDTSAMNVCAMQALGKPNENGVMIIRMKCKLESEVEKESMQ